MYKEYKEIKGKYNIIPLRALWIFPYTVIHFDLGRSISLNALDNAMMEDSKIILLNQKDPNEDNPKPDGLYEYGILAEVKQSFKINDGNTRILVEGLERVRLDKIETDKGYFQGECTIFQYDPKEVVMTNELKAISNLCIDDIREYVSFNENIPNDIIFTLMDLNDPSRLADILISYLQLSNDKYYEILSELNIYRRLEKVHVILREELKILLIEEEINKKVSSELKKSQKDYILKEQLKVIKEELGMDLEDSDNIVDSYVKKIDKLDIDEDSRESLYKEVEKIDNFQAGSPDQALTINYLDTVLSLPWSKKTRDISDISKSSRILDRDHYGLKDVKKRILEYIAVLNLKEDANASIICLVGPPGVGKTSIARGIAKSLNREFESIKLGGITDESEIRGHRKTYIGAMPGRIINALIRAKSKNPVILLDEIDKIGNDYRGDPSSGLLEVLDPSQNSEFVDRFIEIPFDLSKVLFLATANSLQNIPDPLLDRMEVISLSGYNEYEKFEIAKRHLIKKQRQENGLTSSQISISDLVIKKIIKSYTREAGVRDLERNIAKIMRRAAVKIVENKDSKVNVSMKNYREFLDKEIFLDDSLEKKDQVGLATGLAWTEVGGEVLQIEVNTMKGNGKLQLTGSLGDIMKESAMAGLSYIKANAKKFDINEDDLSKMDIHVHVPEGATPKDGPSAGITMALAIFSAICGRKIKGDIAMTGEITIRGRVLPIGGLKEKALAAHRYNYKKIIIPKDNLRDLDEIEEFTKKDIEFIPVENMEEVLKVALI